MGHLNSVCSFLIVVTGLAAPPLFGQSKPETINYITSELKSCATERFVVKEVSFSDGGRTCKISLAAPGQFVDQVFELSVPDLDIFALTKLVKTGTDEYIQIFDLIASPRGTGVGLRRNMTTLLTPQPIVSNVLDARKIKGLELAFAHLNMLLTGTARLFQRTPSSTEIGSK